MPTDQSLENNRNFLECCHQNYTNGRTLILFIYLGSKKIKAAWQKVKTMTINARNAFRRDRNPQDLERPLFRSSEDLNRDGQEEEQPEEPPTDRPIYRPLNN